MTEVITGLPKPDHIEYLMAHPETADRFDKLYGEGASLKYLPVDKTSKVTAEDEPKGIIEDVADQSVVGIKTALRETLETLEGLSDFAEEKIPLGGLKFGKDAQNGIIEYVSPGEFKQKEGEGLFETISEKTIKPEELDEEAQTLAGQFTRPVTQFTTGFVGGGWLLKPVKYYNKLNGFVKSMVKGGLADFTVFDEHEARLTDFIEEYYPETADSVFTYLSADEDDGFFEGKMKNAIEGSIIGGMAEGVFRVIKWTKDLKKARNKNDIKEANAKIKKQKEILNKLDDVTEEEFELLGKLSRGVPVQLKTKISPASKVKLKEVVSETDYIKQAKSNLFKVRAGMMSFREASELPINFKRAEKGTEAQVKSMEDVLLVTKAIYDNVEKLNSTASRVKSHDETMKGAQKIISEGVLPTLFKGDRLVREMDTGDDLITALEFVYNGLARSTIDATKKYKLGKITEKEVDNLWELTAKTQELYKLTGTMPARMMNIRNTFLKQTPKAVKNLEVAIEKARFRPDKKTKKVLYDKVAGFDDDNAIWGLARTIREIATLQKGGIEKFNELFINAILSNPKTHGINSSSNLIQAIVRPIELMYGSGFGLIDRQSMMEAIGTTAGLFKYFSHARASFMTSFKRGDSILTRGINKVDLPGQAIGGKTGETIRIPTRFLTAEDEFFKAWNYSAKVYGMAFSEAFAKGLSRKKTITLPNGKKTSEFQQYIDDYMDDAYKPSGEGANERALDYAKENTFTKELGDDTMGGRFQKLVNTVPIMRAITPFVRTPVNLARFVWDRSPILKYRKAFIEELKSNDPAVASQARGKLMLGNSIFAGAIALAWNDKITGGYPKDKYLRRQLMDAGWQPYSFKWNDKYYSYERMDPWSSFFGLIADFVQVGDELTVDERQSLAEVNKMALIMNLDTSEKAELAGGMVLKGAKHFTNKVYLKGLNEIITVLESDEKNKGGRWLKQKISALVPSIIPNVINDEIYREARTISDTIKTRHFAYGDVDPSFNVLGEVRTRQNGFWERFLLPSSVSKQGKDIVMDEFVRLNQRFTPLQDKQGNAKKLQLSAFKNKDDVNAWRRWNELIGTVKLNGMTLRERLEKDIQSKRYKEKLTDNPLSEETSYRGSKVDYINKIIKAYQKKAKQQLFREKFFSENDLPLMEGFRNDKINNAKAKRGLDLLPLK